jgi:hypothetical protein
LGWPRIVFYPRSSVPKVRGSFVLAPDFGQPGPDLALEQLDQLAIGTDQRRDVAVDTCPDGQVRGCRYPHKAAWPLVGVLNGHTLAPALRRSRKCR